MSQHRTPRPTSRRTFLWTGLGGLLGLVLAACGLRNDETTERRAPVEPTEAVRLPPTPACGEDEEFPTATNPEGPFYTAGVPQRQSLIEPDMSGTPLLLTGTVLTTDCRPVSGAVLDFWQADDTGQYDNEGFRLRGQQTTGQDGAYHLETILPGQYPGRTRHIHVKVTPPDGTTLTTQLYFEGEAANQQDSLFLPELALPLTDDPASDGQQGAFDFVLDV